MVLPPATCSNQVLSAVPALLTPVTTDMVLTLTGPALPDGKYRFAAKATSMGKTGPVSVNTMSVVTGVSNAGTADNTWLLQVAGGKTINLVDVKRVGY